MQKRPLEIFVLDLDHLEEVKTKSKWGTTSLEIFFASVSKETLCETLETLMQLRHGEVV